MQVAPCSEVIPHDTKVASLRARGAHPQLRVCNLRRSELLCLLEAPLRLGESHLAGQLMQPAWAPCNWGGQPEGASAVLINQLKVVGPVAAPPALVACTSPELYVIQAPCLRRPGSLCRQATAKPEPVASQRAEGTTVQL